ncbi:MAG TPA: HIT family protein, partial [Terriglobales bacterium]|nr:HIT family protein [Terriglobales bacterium]
MNSAACPFCSVEPERIFHAGTRILGLWDGFPVSDGHALLIPKRHVATWFDASIEERSELTEGVSIARDAIGRRYQPDGFNVGINVGEAAGQTVFHLHVHVIPRYRGDMANPRGGVRHVIPGKGYYQVPVDGDGIGLVNDAAAAYGTPATATAPARLIAGGDVSPLLAP